MWYYKTAIRPITMAIIQMRQPQEVEQPSPRKSNIQPPIFKPQPRRLKANRPRMIIAMIPMISIYLSGVSYCILRCKWGIFRQKKLYKYRYFPWSIQPFCLN